MSTSRQGSFQCPICYDVIKTPVVLRSCGHAFCFDCIDQWFSAQHNGLTCPFCRDQISSKRKAMIKIKPKYDRFEALDQSGSGSQRISNLEVLREQLANKTKEVEQLQADEEAYEQRQRAKFEALDREIAVIRDKLQPLKDKLGEMQRKVTHTLASMPHIAPFFDKVYSEVFKNSWNLQATEPYDNILTAWESARGQAESRRQLSMNLESTKEHIKLLQKRNSLSRSVCNKFQPEQFASRLSLETFERLCGVMGWDYNNIVRAKIGYDIPSHNDNSSTASTNSISTAKKRTAPTPSNDCTSSKITKKTRSFFDHDLLDLDDDGDSI